MKTTSYVEEQSRHFSEHFRQRTIQQTSSHFWQKKIFLSNFFSVQSLFHGKQHVYKTCHLIQTFSINTSVPLLTEFDSITNIQQKQPHVETQQLPHNYTHHLSNQLPI